jgi:2-polyprenyl-3-methyl-5-hydroxy-6-metoxy-1,4-benzoquinol methylase
MSNETLNISKYPHLQVVESVFNKKFPYFSKVLGKRFEEFGTSWADEFERELQVFFGSEDERLRSATYGYGLFALDGLKLQKKFDKTLQYEAQRYEDVAGEVYLNRDYMFTLYLPGILLSHYLWPHHYNQKLWFVKNFIPLVKNEKSFCDVGVGTGFYSREMLRHVPGIRGNGYDISEFSLEHTRMMVDRWDFGGRYTTNVRDIIKNPPTEKADCAVNVEVLEHLEDPVTFLKALRNMAKTGGYAFITAAIDAPNKDHIYLYRDLASVERELNQASFKVVMAENFPAFPNPKPGETVPQNGSFIVQAV